MKIPRHLYGTVLLAITINAVALGREPTLQDFSNSLKNITEKHCTDLSKLPMNLQTYYNNIPNSLKEPKYRLALAAGLVQPGRATILKPTAKYAEVKARIKGDNLCSGTYSHYTAVSAGQSEDGRYIVRIKRRFTPDPWADKATSSAFFLDTPATELTYLFVKDGRAWKGTPQSK